MNRDYWEQRYDEALSIAFHYTTHEEYANEDDFRDEMWEIYQENADEEMILSIEDREWGI
jgi:hypothetical protein